MSFLRNWFPAKRASVPNEARERETLSKEWAVDKKRRKRWEMTIRTEFNLIAALIIPLDALFVLQVETRIQMSLVAVALRSDFAISRRNCAPMRDEVHGN